MTDLEPDYFAAAGDDLDEVDDGQRKSAHGQSTDGPSTAILTGRVKDIPSQRKTLTWADESQIEEVLKGEAELGSIKCRALIPISIQSKYSESSVG